MRISMMASISKNRFERPYRLDRRHNTNSTNNVCHKYDNPIVKSDSDYIVEDDVVILDDKTFPYIPYDCE